MKPRYAFVLFSAVAMHAAMAQYCQPTFLNGCDLWQNQEVMLADMAWVTDGVCTDGDRTGTVATVTAGVPLPMSVTSGNWTGCAVWVDLDNDELFSDQENLHYEYVGGDPGYAYDFTITIPANTASGEYRMRVLAAWGSDGFLSTNTNGYGACGSYQHGNYNDFTLAVETTTGITDHAVPSNGILVFPNPGSNVVSLSFNGTITGATIRSSDGRLVREIIGAAALDVMRLDVNDLPVGTYVIQAHTDAGPQRTVLIKQ